MAGNSAGRAPSYLLDPMLDALKDGRWHDRHELFTEVAWHLPSGYALVRREARRVVEYKRMMRFRYGLDIKDEDVPPRNFPENRDDAIYRSRKSLFNDHLSDIKRVGYVEVEPERVRITAKGQQQRQKRLRARKGLSSG